MKRITLLLIAGFCMTALGVEHPHLLFSAGELPALREKIKSGVPRRSWYALRGRCDKYLTLKTLPKMHDRDNEKDPLTELLLAWHLSEKTVYRDKFLELYPKADLDKLVYDKALIFDLGYQVLSEKQRQDLKDKLLAVQAKAGNPLRVNFYAFSNWGLIPGMKGVRENAALYGHPEYKTEISERAAKLIHYIFRNWVDDKGAMLEGGAYLNYPMERIGGVSCFVLHRKGFDLAADTYLDKLPYFLLTTEMPDGTVPPLGDSNPSQKVSNFARRLLLNLLPESPAMNMLAARAAPEDAPDPISGIFFYRKPSGEAVIPLTDHYPQNGITSYKSSNAPDAFYSISQTRYHRGHAQEDVGSFILTAYGENWIIDPGYAEGALAHHNMVMIDGQGTKPNGGYGIVRMHFATPSFTAMSSDLTNFWNTTKPNGMGDPVLQTEYPVAKAVRQWAVIGEDRQFGVPPYVVVTDAVRRDNQTRTYTLLLQADKSKNIQTGQDRAEFTGKNGSLQIEFIIPKGLELAPEKYSNESRFGKRDFQRLQATQQRQSGVFCTLLYPRTAQMPMFKRESGAHGFAGRLVWPGAVDYLDFDTGGDLIRKNCMKFMRISPNDDLRKELPKKLRYLMLDGDNWNIGKLPVVKVETRAGLAERDRIVVTSAAFDGGTLLLDIYTHPLTLWQVPFLTKITAYAPDVREVICNGKSLDFTRDGAYINITAHSRVVKTAQQLREREYRSWLNVVEQNHQSQPTQETVPKEK